MITVFANGRSIVHKGDRLVNTCAVPDVCKTPSPGGPVPVPYVNVALNSALTNGAKKVKVQGNPAGLQSSKLSTSTGDEGGTAGGGMISGKVKGAMTWGSASFDVQFEGKGVVRFMDVTQHNGNTFNSAFIQQGGTGFAYGDDAKCPVCDNDPAKHQIHETEAVAGLAQQLFVELNRVRASGGDGSEEALVEKYLQLDEESKEIYRRCEHDVAQIASTTHKTAESNVRDARQKLEQAQPQEKALFGRAFNQARQVLEREKARIRTRRAEMNRAREPILAEMKQCNAKIRAGSPVLRVDESVGTYIEGYMVGVVICRCGAKKLCATSGTTPPGFQEAAGKTVLRVVSGFTPSDRQSKRLNETGRREWKCAAPQLLKNSGSHTAGTMTERWYSPAKLKQTGSVSFSKKDDRPTPPVDARVTQDFGHGETVPSCETCQELLPEMLCENDTPCS
mgnify:CR=1 FL=1